MSAYSHRHRHKEGERVGAATREPKLALVAMYKMFASVRKNVERGMLSVTWGFTIKSQKPLNHKLKETEYQDFT